MPSIKAIGLRMKAVQSTAKITKAMKMVAASKLKGAERMMLNARPFAASINGLMDTKLAPAEDEAARSRRCCSPFRPTRACVAASTLV
jgi:F0F1-type ATP synthase gamma subunit